MPHPYGGRAIPLAERQTVALREKVKALEGKLAELIKFAEENDAISEKVHRLSVALAGARDFPALARSLYFHLREDFAVPHVALRVWGKAVPADFDEAQAVDRGAAPAGRRRWAAPQCGPAQGNAFAPWFGEAAEHVRSLALVPLGQTAVFGAARARQRGPEALLSRDGHALPAAHRRAMRGRRHGRCSWLSLARIPRCAEAPAPPVARRRCANYAHALEVLLQLHEGSRLLRWSRPQVRRFVAMLHAQGPRRRARSR